MKGKKITAYTMAVLLAAASVTGCGKNAGENNETEEQIETEVKAAISDSEAILLGANGSLGVFNPLFAESEADKDVCSLIFDTICTVNELGELEEAVGKLLSADEVNALEEEEEKEPTDFEALFAKTEAGNEETDSDETDEEEDGLSIYQLQLNRDLKFSDGTPVTIDDVIFTWKLMADPFYQGTYSLAEVPVLGMEEYYYDTMDVEAYQQSLTTNYSDDISEEDFINYLIETKLNGWFDGNLPGDLDGKGTTWVEYLESNGYDASGIEDNPEELLKLLAKCEYEKYSFAYDPYTYYQNQSHEGMLENGVEVADIEGIVKTDEYTCAIAFEGSSISEEDLRAMTVIPVLSQDYYGSDYEKGDISKLEADTQKNAKPVGSGAYQLYTAEDGEAVLEVNALSRMKTQAQYVKVISVSDEEQVQALKDGRISLASFQLNEQAEFSAADQLVPVDGNGFYYLGINTDMVSSPESRQALMKLVNKELLSADAETLSEILPASVGVQTAQRISDQITLEAQTWPMTRLSAFYPDIEEILESRMPEGTAEEESIEEESDVDDDMDDAPDADDDSMKDAAVVLEEDEYEYDTDKAYRSFASAGYNNWTGELLKNGEQLKLTMGISEDLPNAVKAIAYQLKADLEELGAVISVTEYDEGTMQATIPTAAFDLWIGMMTDLSDHNMESYFRYGAENNYFHNQNGYVDAYLDRINERTDAESRDYFIEELMEQVMESAYCRPLCQEISEVYVADSTKLDWAITGNLNEYDTLAEIISGITLK